MPEGRSIFVLVHGAWHGGWCWRDLAQELRALGHVVFAPTLTGLGERSHLARPDLSFTTHVQDIKAVIETEELSDVVLVGHSYGGQVIAQVADELAERRVRRLVFLDGVLLDRGENLFEQFPPEQQRVLESMGKDGYLSPPPAAPFGIPPSDSVNTAWLQRRLRPHPFDTFLDRIGLETGRSLAIPGSYILSTAHHSPVMARSSQRARNRGWPIYEIEAGHDAMITMPAQLAALLARDAAL